MVLQLVILPRMEEQSEKALVDSVQQKLEVVPGIDERRLSRSSYLAGWRQLHVGWFKFSHQPAIRYLTNEAGKALTWLQRGKMLMHGGAEFLAALLGRRYRVLLFN